MTRREVLQAAAVAAAASAVSAATYPPEIEARIHRIEHGLLPRPQLRHDTPQPSALADRMLWHKVPGTSIAVIRNYEIEWTRPYGVKEAGKSAPITADTLFQAGSISKPVAAVAALRLMETGRLDLDEDINRYLTSWKVPANGPWQPRITIRQLVSHTAGLTVHGFPGYPRGRRVPMLVQVLDGAKPANTPAIRVDTVPGTQTRYSGGGYCVLQQLLIDVMKKPFPELMGELVLDPAGMKASSYEQPLPAARARFAASGHGYDGQMVPGGSNIYPEMAAAGLWTTPSDLARFAIQLQLAKAGKPSQLLSAATMNQMLSPQVEESQGLGIFLSGKAESARFGHGGWDEGFVSELVAYQDGGTGAVVMSNSDAGASNLNPEILRSIAKEYGWPGYLDPPRTAAKTNSQTLEGFLGRYELRPGFSFVVRRQSETLSLEPTGQMAMELRFESDTKAFLTAVNAEVSFTRVDSGEITGLTFRQNGRELKAKRVA